jgi:hypoxanthine phosphoribosyltransferase
LENSLDLGQLGRDRFSNLCKVIKDLIIEKDVKFDYIIAAGNSGMSMAHFALLIFEILKKPKPILIPIPFFRYYPGHNEDKNYIFPNKINFKDIKQKAHANSNSSLNILFVDDEIGQGITALGILTLLRHSILESGSYSQINYYIVAEDQGFKIPVSEKSIHFHPIGKEIEGYNNLIFCMIPYDLEHPIIEVFGDDKKLPFHQRANLLLNLPVKDFNNGDPIFSNQLLENARKDIPKFEEYQRRFQDFLYSEIIKNLK